MSYTAAFAAKVTEILNKALLSQEKEIRFCGEKIVETIQNGNCVYFFGCTHAGILAQEAFYRTGGLAIVNPIFPPALTCDVRPITLTSQMERVEGYGVTIVKQYGLKKGDLLFIHSVSGRNAVTIDMALEAKKQGVYIVAITNMEYTKASSARHSSGKRLFECADLVIDNCGEMGDACLEIEGFPQKAAPTSTVVGAAIVNAISAEAADAFLKAGVEPPVFLSANIDGGDAYNARVLEKYASQIKYMG